MRHVRLPGHVTGGRGGAGAVMAAPVEEKEAAAAEPEAGDGDGDGDEAALRRLEELVEELYRFRARLPHSAGGQSPTDDPACPTDAPACPTDVPGCPTDDPACPTDAHGCPTADPDDLVAEMERTLQLMEAVHVSPQARGRALVLRARALGVCAAGAPRAEQSLSRAVKLEPGLGVAWTRLGEARWGRGDLAGARACFAGALAHGEDAEARRLLSMALRAGGGAGGGAGGSLRQSLAQAEAAVRCAPADGRSWYVLGNAYVSLFFAGGQSPDHARRALGAYAQAERVDPEAANNPDLHLNRATLLQYEERFGAALEGLGRASALAPRWEEPRRRHAHLLDFLGRLCALLANRGKLRGKRRRGLQGPLPPSLLGPLGGPGGPRPSPLAALRPGPNPRRALLARVIFSLTPEGGRALVMGVADGAGGVAAVTVYNAAPDWGVLVGDALALPEPILRQHHVAHQGKTFSFLGIRVSSPLSLVVNGRRPPGPALAPARLALRNDPAPAATPPPHAPPDAPSNAGARWE
ncbi:LOW QUALITY PROTEIN: tetratricopeptide repeat protein 5 [Phalacrocorax carbo]|uniref:LOW QUALITY PROTEIN: tetratricopeptide repeat protein 5 n=1 Tax=Phalacrocorax carbo TaxID=9209 RepID=UPI00311A65A8